MEFEWDASKAVTNLAKHKVPLEVAYAFDWIGATILPDLRFDYGEARYVAYGWDESDDGYVIAFTMRGSVYRIISVRPFGRKEFEIYVK